MDKFNQIVQKNIVLNTLIKNDEMPQAIELAKKAYELGIDAIIVQDLGLARYLIKNFSGGTRTIILTVLISAVVAIIKPIKDESEV